jgi:hypothetical protein
VAARRLARAFSTLSWAAAAAFARSGLQRSAAEPDFVSVEIAVCDLAHAIRVGFPLHRIDSPVIYLRDERSEVIDKESVHGVAGMLRPNALLFLFLRTIMLS